MTPLPHQSDKRFLVWTGLETELIFTQGIDLPGFASFPLLEDTKTRGLLQDYIRAQIDLAARFGFGTVLESVTWVANLDRAKDLGYDAIALQQVNREAIRFLADVRANHGAEDALISANIGPRDDAYAPSDTMAPAEAEAYHSAQINTLAETDADLVSAYTLSNCGEAIGIVRAATKAQLPCVVAFTVETDGRLPSGQPLDEAIAQTDTETGAAAAYFMLNCAHPDHFAAALPENPRLGGVVVNASRCSHAELDEATELDAGDPLELGAQVGSLIRSHPSIRVFGGCCGTDMRHLKAMAETVRGLS